MDRPLPSGWISQVDQNSGHRFYVDTKANPPRSIWVHPLEDEQYLREHPEAREKARPAADEMQSQYSAPPTPPVASSSDRAGYASPSGSKPEKHGIFGKLKDKVVGTKEEREQEKRHKAEQKRQMLEVRVLFGVNLGSLLNELLLAARTSSSRDVGCSGSCLPTTGTNQPC